VTAALNPDQLRDIHLPAPVSWWPPAPGWWLVVGLMLILVAVGYWLLRRRRRQRWRREALAELQRLQQTASPAQQLTQLSVLLRRVAVTCFPRQDVASLTGPDWLAFLERHAGGFTVYAELLLEAPYRAETDLDLQGLFQQAEQWIRRVPTGSDDDR
jgi:LPXTG-motif cell wall-anchored protein